MEDRDLIFQQYKLYSEQKEQFINRSFGINRFYLCISIVLLVLVSLCKTLPIAYLVSLSTILSIVGMCTSALWWMNMDSYNILIKIKFSKVIEEIEKQLPIQPYKMEHDAIEEYRNNKKVFLFSDMQKLFAIVMFIVFFISLIDELIPMVLRPFI